MILGRKLGNWLNTPALRLKAEANKCIDCQMNQISIVYTISTGATRPVAKQGA